jgi:hypothetical protein
MLSFNVHSKVGLYSCYWLTRQLQNTKNDPYSTPYESRYQHYLRANTRMKFQKVPELVGALVLTLEKAIWQQWGKAMCLGLCSKIANIIDLLP